MAFFIEICVTFTLSYIARQVEIASTFPLSGVFKASSNNFNDRVIASLLLIWNFYELVCSSSGTRPRLHLLPKASRLWPFSIPFCVGALLALGPCRVFAPTIGRLPNRGLVSSWN